ncbi:MAG: sulfatase family protein [Fimbriiglobus sp.]
MMRGLVWLVALGWLSTGLAQERPNIIWITCEDTSPTLGCYGDPHAKTPRLDAFAQEGVRFEKAFSHAPVCAPSRSGLITGQYPTTLGSHHMRSKLTKTPPLFVDELRKAGYFTAWPGKTDFNFDTPKGWVDTVEDWTKKPDLLPKDKPFFAYFNITVSHESQARATEAVKAKRLASLPENLRVDSAKLKLPPYYPDTPIVRENVATHYTTVTLMDAEVGKVLDLIQERGWHKNTVVVFFGDHGWGLPRGKRWPYDSGLRVPMIARWPDRITPVSTNAELTCFLDLAPTALSLAGAKVPEAMPGRVILGEKKQPAPHYLFAARDRMDEAPDRIRSVRGDRFRYVRNYHPEKPYFQWLNYLDEMPIMQEWRRLAFEGKLNDTQKLFMSRTKPKEELYNLETDPYEIKNLANDPQYCKTLAEMSVKLDEWIVKTKDLGEVPEAELIRRGIVRDVLSGEYTERVKKHPKTSPVP